MTRRPARITNSIGLVKRRFKSIEKKRKRE